MQPDQPHDLYATILRYATLPVLLLVLALCFVITNFLMSTRWQQARRNKQIRKAVAERQARVAEAMAIKDETKE
jgi:hypothetical protein